MQLNFRNIYLILTTGDKALISSLILISLFSFAGLKSASKPAQIARVTVHDTQILPKDLANSEKFSLDGAAGQTQISIFDNSIKVINSDCPQRLCVRQGAIRNTGEIIVCIPNKITIWIEGQPTNKFDAITG